MAAKIQISLDFNARKYTLRTASGRLDLRYLGTGSFTVAFSYSNGKETRVFAAVKEPALDKRAMAHAKTLAPDNPHLPPLTDVGPVLMHLKLDGTSELRRLFELPLLTTYDVAPARQKTKKIASQIAELRRCVPEEDKIPYLGAKQCLEKLPLDGSMAEALRAIRASVDHFSREARQRNVEALFETPDWNLAIYKGSLVLLDTLFYFDLKQSSQIAGYRPALPTYPEPLPRKRV